MEEVPSEYYTSKDVSKLTHSERDEELEKLFEQGLSEPEPGFDLDEACNSEIVLNGNQEIDQDFGTERKSPDINRNELNKHSIERSSSVTRILEDLPKIPDGGEPKPDEILTSTFSRVQEKIRI